MIPVVLGVVVTGLMLGYVFPVGLNAVNENPTYDVTLEEGTQQQIKGELSATVTSSTAGSDATVELENTDTGDTESQTINEGETATYTNLDGGVVNVTVVSVTSGTPNTVDAEIEPETGFGWSQGSKSVFGVLGLFLVLVPLVVLAREAMNA